jgi:ubiquinone/menaquinone biosynthesis C-methylase UbiE
MFKNKKKEILKLVKSNYNEIAKEFAVSRNKKMWPEIIKQVKKIQKNKNILDLGCGDGRLLEEVDKDSYYVGIDNSKELLKIAKEKYKNRKKTIFLEDDVLSLEKIRNKKFDYLFFIAVLHHLPSKKLRRKALLKIKEKMDLDSKLIISVWDMWQWKKYRKKIIGSYILNIFKGLKPRDLIFEWKGRDKSLRYYFAFNKRILKREINRAGFKVLEFKRDKGGLYLIVKK